MVVVVAAGMVVVVAVVVVVVEAVVVVTAVLPAPAAAVEVVVDRRCAEVEEVDEADGPAAVPGVEGVLVALEAPRPVPRRAGAPPGTTASATAPPTIAAVHRHVMVSRVLLVGPRRCCGRLRRGGDSGGRGLDAECRPGAQAWPGGVVCSVEPDRPTDPPRLGDPERLGVPGGKFSDTRSDPTASRAGTGGSSPFRRLATVRGAGGAVGAQEESAGWRATAVPLSRAGSPRRSRPRRQRGGAPKAGAGTRPVPAPPATGPSWPRRPRRRPSRAPAARRRGRAGRRARWRPPAPRAL